MARVKGGVVSRRRRRKFLQRAEGFYSSGSRCYIHVREKTDKALQYAYRDRKVKKREFRALWIQRINAAARLNGTTYSKLMHAISEKGLELDRKVLADLAVKDAAGFAALVSQVGARA
ncbi:MAG TPA: 50S ribosomal protein L20 [Pseudobdellovibrionaceae bacterium]|jgi:large subunit ribosomal protein L20|nr:50S ribosomal protein L20 [Pseudobdellovibrionaceae bacterium]